jgi:hypothetical protein
MLMVLVEKVRRQLNFPGAIKNICQKPIISKQDQQKEILKTYNNKIAEKPKRNLKTREKDFIQTLERFIF